MMLLATVASLATTAAIACAVYAYRLHRRCKYLKGRLKAQIVTYNINCDMINGANAKLRRTRAELKEWKHDFGKLWELYQELTRVIEDISKGKYDNEEGKRYLSSLSKMMRELKHIPPTDES